MSYAKNKIHETLYVQIVILFIVHNFQIIKYFDHSEFNETHFFGILKI